MDILQLFANPAMLSAAVLAAAPIVIHLLSRLRAREMDFPTLRFLRQTTEKTSRRRRIENWLLLVLRTLALLMLTLAAAGPILKGGGFFGGSGISSIVLYDDSLSTDRADYRITASRAIRETIRNLPQGSHWCLRYNCRPYDGAAWQRLATHSTEETEAAVKALKPTGVRGMLSLRTAQALVDLSQQKGRSPELIIFTDGQQSEWQNLQQYCTKSNLQKNLRIYLFAPQLETPENLCTKSSNLQVRLPLNGEKATIQQEIQYYGNKPVNATVSCFFQDKLQSKQEAALLPQSSSNKSLFFQLEGQGWQSGFTILNGDGFPADNRRNFAVKVRNKLDVLLLGKNEQTFTKASPFLCAALAPLPQLPVSLTQASQGQIPQLNLEKYTAIIACLDQTPSRANIRKLLDYVSRNGILVLMPGTQVDIKAWNENWKAEESGTLAGCLLKKIDFSKSPCGIQPQPNAREFFPDLNSAAMKLLGNVKIFQAYNTNINQTSASEVLSLFNSLPFLLTQNHGRGKVILWTSPPVNSWGLLQARPVFVPLMLSFLKMGPAVIANDSECGLPLNLSATESFSSATVNVDHPDKTNETIRFSNISKDNPALIRNTMHPGIYTVTIKETGKVIQYAVNPSTDEGDLTAFDPKNPPPLKNYGEVYLCKTPEELANTLSNTRKDLSLRLPLEIIVLLLLVAEGLIGMRRGMQQNV